MNSNTLGIISAITALVATIVGPVVAFRTARAQIRASVLASNRARWIESLRERVAAAVAQINAFLLVRSSSTFVGPAAIADDPLMLGRVEQSMRTATEIRLLLNPTEDDCRQLMALIEGSIARLRSSDPQDAVERDVQRNLDDAVRVTQAILKREWLRVKRNS